MLYPLLQEMDYSRVIVPSSGKWYLETKIWMQGIPHTIEVPLHTAFLDNMALWKSHCSFLPLQMCDCLLLRGTWLPCSLCYLLIWSVFLSITSIALPPPPLYLCLPSSPHLESNMLPSESPPTGTLLILLWTTMDPQLLILEWQFLC